MRKNILAIALFLLACSPEVFSDFIFITPPVDTTTTTTTAATNPTTTNTVAETPTETVNPPQAINDFIALVVGATESVTGNLFNNDLDATGVTIRSSLIGEYGALELQNSGEYTYTIFNNGTNIGLTDGEKVTDVFEYTAYNSVNQQSTAQLTIELIAKPSNTSIIAFDDYVTVRANSILSATGDVTTNDSNGQHVQLNSSPASKYGYLVLNVEGTYTYTLINSAPSILSLKFGDTITDSFVYTYSDKSGQSTTARIHATIIGNPVDGAGNTLFDSTNTEEASDTFTIRDAGGDTLPILTNKVINRTTENNNNSFQLNSSPASQYGFLLFSADGNFTYNLYRDSPAIIALKVGDVVTDSFSYTYLNQFGQRTTAKLNITIIGNPVDEEGHTIYEQFDNVDIEFNDRSAQATPLNSSRRIKGHLHHLGDKDWYTFSSSGNEIITATVCPQGSRCFGQKNWVLYIFDGDLITTEMEEKVYTFERWLDETGKKSDLSGEDIISGISSAGDSNHLYLAYRSSFFEEALIGVIDPCFDKNNSVEIGVGELPKNYLLAVSSPLIGTGNTAGSDDGCGAGTVVLTRPGRSIEGKDAATPPESKLYTTTEKYISVGPFSDDQYSITITGTGIHPLLSEEAQANSATYNALTGAFIIPKVRVFNELYQAELKFEDPTADNTNKTALTFVLDSLNSLGVASNTDTYQATYDPESQQVIIPRVTNSTDGKAYSVILQYSPPANDKVALLEVISFILIQ
jgi:VCBS repeat-containing protein